MAWTIELSRSAEKSLEKLDRNVARRLQAELLEISALENPRSRGKGLTANKSGLWRYRVGDYRIVCRIEDGRLLILVLALGHRSRIYD